ncbi:hypothetical protein ABHN05_12975 [Brevibacillus laterosporus]|uniref:hypothetical protein n=1 Tax=Brevibacillus laterosporus TaxID=1465 RepID=UPI0013870CB2|nr:hypothetical protein [Brevibacillus laterosporus]MED4762128.1 hypothetical protein [Brevibacillus laterosporus]
MAHKFQSTLSCKERYSVKYDGVHMPHSRVKSNKILAVIVLVCVVSIPAPLLGAMFP